jgi:tRNA threonylcarbamoyl adenosine modification protein (Sua5/YciO/YrdC/YwlC family)
VRNVKRWTIGDAPTESQIDEVAVLLRSGGILLMPTDTIYGLHALANDDSAARVAEIKGRDEGKRFVVVGASVDQLEATGAEVPDVLRTIWPAPVTAVMRRGGSTIAARVPALDWLRRLLEQTGPLFSTSANRSGEPPITEPSDLEPKLLEQLDGVIDGGRIIGKASAIVDFTGTEPRFIRDGDPRFTQSLRKTLSKKL